MHWTDRIGCRMTPRDLHVFLVVAKEGNMARAAERLAISRPVVSKAIAGLEHTLGVRLLDRNASGVEATHYGRALLKHSAAVFGELRQSVEEINFLADPSVGEVRFGCTEIIAAGLVAAVIDQLSRRYPGLSFRMEVGDAPTRLNFLRERECELVIARHMVPSSTQDLDAEVLFYERPSVVTGPRNKWLGRRNLRLAELIDEPWILTQREAQPSSPIFEAFSACGLKLPRATILSDSLNLRNSLLATGRFLTMMPGSVLRLGPERSLLKVLPVKLDCWHEPIAIVTMKNRTLSSPAQLFINCVREIAGAARDRKLVLT
jgi:DNA-binding transcriptional LysR family regulator